MEYIYVYNILRDNIELTFQEKYEVYDIHKLAIKIHEFKKEIEHLKALIQSYELKTPNHSYAEHLWAYQERKSGSDGGDAPPPAGGGDTPIHHSRILSPRQQDTSDFYDMYAQETNEYFHQEKVRDHSDRER